MNVLYVRRIDYKVYTGINFVPSETVDCLARRICSELKWPPPILLHLVKLSGKLPSKEEEASAVALMDPSCPLGDVGIVKGGGWLLAQLEGVDSRPTSVLDATTTMLKKISLLKDTLSAKIDEGQEKLLGMIQAVAYNSSHALTLESHTLVKSGAIFKVMESATKPCPLFCGFFVGPTIALTINHDPMFKQALPFSVHATTSAGEKLTFDVIHTNATLDFSVLYCTSARSNKVHFSLQGFSELDPGVEITLVSMSIGNGAALAVAGAVAFPPYSVHKGRITDLDGQFIYYGDVETWAGDSGGALLFKEGCVVGMHLEILGPQDKESSPPSRSSPHYKMCKALCLTHKDVLAAVSEAENTFRVNN